MDFESVLTSRFQPANAMDVDATIRLVAGGRTLTTFTVCRAALTFDASLTADVTFTFDREETAHAIVTGTANPIDAFMAGRFRSDGHLPMAFVLLGLFNPGFGAIPPP